MKKVEFFRHNIGREEIRGSCKTLRSIFLTTGPKTRDFEQRFAEYLGSKHCLGVTSWTTGAFITLKALGINNDDEIITTPMTFVATPNVILHCGARPIFVDVEPDTGNINVGLIEKAITSKTKAILPVHLYGQMCDMKGIKKIASRYNLFIIEDAAHCIEGSRDGVRPGRISDAAIFSFYATKNITSGEGGAIVTSNKDLADKLYKYRLHGMSKGADERYLKRYQHWDMELLGYKCNMFDIQAALLIGQLERIENFLKRREQICQRYENEFSKIREIEFPKKLPHTKHARHAFTIWVPPDRRDIILAELQEQGIGVGVHFRAVHLLNYYRRNFGYRKGDFPEAEKIGARTITLPLYPKLTNIEVSRVVNAVKECF